MPRSTPRFSAGFSLVEIMVGMVIGLLGVIVIMQVYSVSEGQKRSATGAGDAQNNGAIALYGMQRDIRQAAYGISAPNLFGCSVTMPSGATLPLAPVVINPAATVIPAGDANTDTLLVMYGNTNGETQGNSITTVAGNVYTVTTPGAFAANDYVIAAPAAPIVATAPAACAGTLIFDQVTATAASVTVATGDATVTVGYTLYNLGQAPKVLAYAIRGGNLTVCDYLANNCGSAGNVNNSAIWMTIADNIVSLRAEYGRDTLTVPIAALPVPPAPLPSYVVDTYDQTLPATSCAWARAPAVKIVLTARSQQYEKGTVTTTAPTWEDSAAFPIDLTTDTDWQHYRYKVFQTIVPLRNITWMGVQPLC